VLRAGLENFSKLEREPKLGGKLKLRGNEVVIAINDRLAAPNTDESFAAVAAEIEAVAKDLFADAEISVEREPDRRRKFALRIKASRSFSADELLDRLKDD
jgi:NAD/NADP transhydrogenase alpha subunit